MYIRVEFSDAGLWGETDPDAEGYDAQASASKFAEMLTEELENEFPEADVTVRHTINDRHMVDGSEDVPGEIDWVGEVIDRVYQPFNWMVEA